MRMRNTSQGCNLFWTVLALTLLHVRCFENPPYNYFGGLKYDQNPDQCTSAQFEFCDALCPSSQYSRCLNVDKKNGGICFCHVEPNVDPDYPCRFVKTLAPGSGEGGFDTVEEQCLFSASFSFSRSNVDVYVCKKGDVESCFLQDFLDDIAVYADFGGLTQVGVFSCTSGDQEKCQAFCPDSYVACITKNLYQSFCFCHTPSPAEVNELPPSPDSVGRVCRPGRTGSPGGVQDPNNQGLLEPSCYNYAIIFDEPVETYLCAKPGDTFDGVCVLKDQPGGPFTTTTTTTTEATTSTEVTTTEGGFSFFGSGSGSTGCNECKNAGFFTLFVCPFICISFQIVRFFTKLITNTFFKSVDKLFDSVTSTLDSFVGALSLD